MAWETEYTSLEKKLKIFFLKIKSIKKPTAATDGLKIKSFEL